VEQAGDIGVVADERPSIRRERAKARPAPADGQIAQPRSRTGELLRKQFGGRRVRWRQTRGHRRLIARREQQPVSLRPEIERRVLQPCEREIAADEIDRCRHEEVTAHCRQGKRGGRPAQPAGPRARRVHDHVRANLLVGLRAQANSPAAFDNQLLDARVRAEPEAAVARGLEVAHEQRVDIRHTLIGAPQRALEIEKLEKRELPARSFERQEA